MRGVGPSLVPSLVPSVLAVLEALAAVVWPSLVPAELAVAVLVGLGGRRNQASGAGRARRSAA